MFYNSIAVICISNNAIYSKTYKYKFFTHFFFVKKPSFLNNIKKQYNTRTRYIVFNIKSGQLVMPVFKANLSKLRELTD